MASKSTTKLKYKCKDGKSKVIPKELLPSDYWCEITLEFYLFIVRELLKLEVIQPRDYQTVQLLGDVHHQYEQASESIRTDGLVYKTLSAGKNPSPIIKANPSQKIAQDSLIQLQKLMDSLGMTPKSRGEFKDNQAPSMEIPRIAKYMNR